MIRVERSEVERHAVGASELGAVLGCDPYTTPLALYRRKRGLDLEPTDNEAMRIGRMLEGPVVALARTVLPEGIRRNRRTFLHPEAPLFATPDAFVGRDRVLEVKVVGVRGAWDWDDAPPCRVQLQVQGQLLVTGRAAGYVAALIGTELRLFTVPADPIVADVILRAVRSFADDHLDARVAPDPLTYGEKWFAVIEQLRGLDAVVAEPGPDAQLAGDRLVAIRDDVGRLEDEAKEIRLELAGAMLAAGATKLQGIGWTGALQETKAGATLVVRARNGTR